MSWVLLILAVWLVFNIGLIAGLWLTRCWLPDRRRARDLAAIEGCWDASTQWHESRPSGEHP